jgi:hypothetical protein
MVPFSPQEKQRNKPFSLSISQAGVLRLLWNGQKTKK